MTARFPGNRRPALALLAAFASISFAPPVPSARGDDPSRLESLDLFVLVDVSRSMYLTRPQMTSDPFDPAKLGRPGGSDPERQRWDAVRLLLDLLTADDRVTILPFNEVTPAQYTYAPYQPFEIPGHVADQLREPRWDNDRLGRTVEEFAHNRDFPPGFPDFKFYPNKDNGGTGIFYALKEANRRIATEARQVARKPVILLLTDGDDTELALKEGAEKRRKVDQDNAALLALIQGDRPPRIPIPVYTMGLGNDVKDDLLFRIARLTGGSYRKIGPATELVPTFRDLLWSLKYCWIKPGPDARHSREMLEGILDLGVLSYRSQPGETFARADRLPAPSPAISDADYGRFPAPTRARRAGNQGRDYLYEYFGPLNRRTDAIDADWTGDPAEAPRSVSFSKRTAKPLFRLTEPAEGGEFDRLERLPITASFDDVEPFRREHFLLSYSLRPAGEEARTVPLTPMDANFHAEAELPSTTRAAGQRRYTLRVEAKGLGDPDRRPLADYRLILPERTIEVRDRLRLAADPPAVKLTEKARKATVRIRGVRPLGGEFKLSYRLVPPVKKGVGPLSDKAISVTPRLGSLTDREVVVQGGSGEIDLEIPRGIDQPELGAEYDPGTLVVSAVEGLGLASTELKVPIQLQLRPAALTIAAPGPIRAIAGRSKTPPPSRLKVLDDGGLGQAGQGLKATITLKKLSGTDFPARELWLEPADEPAAAATRSRTLELAIGREFLVRFSPTDNFGQYEYELQARLTGKDERQAVPARAPVSVEHDYPRILLSAPDVKVRVARGSSRNATVGASLLGPSGMRRPVNFQPATPGSDEPFVEVVPLAEPLLVGEAEVPVVLEVKAAADAALSDQYSIKGTIRDLGSKAKEAPFAVNVVVDDLRVDDLTADLKDVRKPIPIELWMGSSHTRRLQLRTILQETLPGSIRIGGDPGPLGISAEVDPRNDGGAFLLPRRASLKPEGDPATSRVLLIEFPSVANVEPNRPYRVYLDLATGPDTGLAPRLLEFEIRYRKINDLKPAAP